MDDIGSAEVGELVGRTAIDVDGDKIGKIKDVYLDDDSGQPEWVAITTGLFGTKVSFAPIVGATVRGDDLVLPYTKSQVKDAPHCDADGHLSPDEEEVLYRHYGMTYGGTTSRADETGDLTARSTTTEGMTAGGMATGQSRLRRWDDRDDLAVDMDDDVDEMTMRDDDLVAESVIVEDDIVNEDVDPNERVLLEEDVVVIEEDYADEPIESAPASNLPPPPPPPR